MYIGRHYACWNNEGFREEQEMQSCLSDSCNVVNLVEITNISKQIPKLFFNLSRLLWGEHLVSQRWRSPPMMPIISDRNKNDQILTINTHQRYPPKHIEFIWEHQRLEIIMFVSSIIYRCSIPPNCFLHHPWSSKCIVVT